MNARADTFGFGAPVYLWLLLIPAALLLVLGMGPAARSCRCGAVCGGPGASGGASDTRRWRSAVLAVRCGRRGTVHHRAGAAVRAHLGARDGGHRLRHPAGRVRVDARQGRGARPLAAVDAIPAHVRRNVSLEGRPHRPGALRVFRRAAAAPDERSRSLVLLSRSPRRSPAVPARGRSDLEYQHRRGRAVGPAADRDERRSCSARPTIRKRFLVISDGQAWSGKVADALAAARARRRGGLRRRRGGTTAGGYIPSSRFNRRLSRIHAVLDRDSLRDDRPRGRRGVLRARAASSDRDVASRIISSARRRAPAAPREERQEELYWRFLLAAALVLCPGASVLQATDRVVLARPEGALAAILILVCVLG